MEVTSDDVRSVRFSGTRHVYDRREVDGFLVRLAVTLDHYEQDLAAARRRLDSLEHALEVAHTRLDVARHTRQVGAGVVGDAPAPVDLEDLERRAENLRIDALAEAAAIRRRAEEDAAQALHAVQAEPEPSPGEGLAELVANLERTEAVANVLGEASEEARRTVQIANQLAAALVADAEEEREAAVESFVAHARAEAEAMERESVRARDLARSEAAAFAAEALRERDRTLEQARRDADQILADARRDAEAVVAESQRDAERLADAAQREARAMERRVRQIRSSLRDLETRFKTLTAGTLAEFSMLGDLIDLDAAASMEDLPQGIAAATPPTPPAESPGFYERRLAGLRSRIEASEAGDDR